MANKLGDLLRKLREEAGLTQEGLVKEIRRWGYEKYSKSDVSKWEHGRTKPEKAVIETLEDIFDSPKGLLLKAAGYQEAAYYRKAMNAPVEQEAKGELVAFEGQTPNGIWLRWDPHDEYHRGLMDMCKPTTAVIRLTES